MSLGKFFAPLLLRQYPAAGLLLGKFVVQHVKNGSGGLGGGGGAETRKRETIADLVRLTRLVRCLTSCQLTFFLTHTHTHQKSCMVLLIQAHIKNDQLFFFFLIVQTCVCLPTSQLACKQYRLLSVRTPPPHTPPLHKLSFCSDFAVKIAHDAFKTT